MRTLSYFLFLPVIATVFIFYLNITQESKSVLGAGSFFLILTLCLFLMARKINKISKKLSRLSYLIISTGTTFFVWSLSIYIGGITLITNQSFFAGIGLFAGFLSFAWWIGQLWIILRGKHRSSPIWWFAQSDAPMMNFLFGAPASYTEISLQSVEVNLDRVTAPRKNSTEIEISSEGELLSDFPDHQIGAEDKPKRGETTSNSPVILKFRGRGSFVSEVVDLPAGVYQIKYSLPSLEDDIYLKFINITTGDNEVEWLDGRKGVTTFKLQETGRYAVEIEDTEQIRWDIEVKLLS